MFFKYCNLPCHLNRGGTIGELQCSLICLSFEVVHDKSLCELYLTVRNVSPWKAPFRNVNQARRLLGFPTIWYGRSNRMQS